MMAEATKTTKAPIQANVGPIRVMKDFTGPCRVFLPIPNSSRIKGIDHSNRKQIQAIRNSPPPFFAAILGMRQILPVPTAIPSMANIMDQRELKTGLFLLMGEKEKVQIQVQVQVQAQAQAQNTRELIIPHLNFEFEIAFEFSLVCQETKRR